MSTLEIRGVRVLGIHGVLDFERENAQPFEFDLDVSFDMGPSGQSDALEDTVNYADVVDAAANVLRGPWCALLERLATLMGEAVLAVDTRIETVEVAVRKLEPPVPYRMTSAGVRVLTAR